jgi:hypothetical protein
VRGDYQQDVVGPGAAVVAEVLLLRRKSGSQKDGSPVSAGEPFLFVAWLPLRWRESLCEKSD